MFGESVAADQFSFKLLIWLEISISTGIKKKRNKKVNSPPDADKQKMR